MTTTLIYKAVEFFNAQGPTDRTIKEGTIFILTMHHVLELVTNEFYVEKEVDENYPGESQLNGVYQGSAQFLWVGEVGTNLTATEDSFVVISTHNAVDNSPIAVYSFPNTPDLDDDTVVDAEYVANAISNLDDVPEPWSRINVYTMGGPHGADEVWITNPEYARQTSWRYDLRDALVRLRPLYSMEQLVFRLPEVSAALKGDGVQDVIMSPLVSLKPITFDMETQVRITFNPYAAGTNYLSVPGIIQFDLYRVDLGEDPTLDEQQREHILTVRWEVSRPSFPGFLYVESMANNPPQDIKGGKSGVYYWVWRAYNFDDLEEGVVLHEMAITLYTKAVNSFSDRVITEFGGEGE